MSSEVDRLVEMIASRVQERLASASRPAALAVLPPRDRGECNNDEAPGEDCASCGSCVVRRPWSVRAIEGAGALRVGAAPGVGQVPTDLAKLIDHTMLKPEATKDEVMQLCAEAKKHRFASVCVNTTWVDPDQARPTPQMQAEVRRRFAPATIAEQYLNLLFGD